MGCGASGEPATKEKLPPLTCPLSKEELAEKGWHKEVRVAYICFTFFFKKRNSLISNTT